MSQNTGQPAPKTKDRTIAGILAILLGALGIHQFYLGNVGTAIIRIIMTITIIGAPVSGLIALVEGIIYLTKSDEDFHQIYVDGNKSWF